MLLIFRSCEFLEAKPVLSELGLPFCTASWCLRLFADVLIQVAIDM